MKTTATQPAAHAQHTPGPWQIASAVGGIGIGISTVRTPGKGSTSIAFVRTADNPIGPMDCQATANARLIAAAPELLVALENFVNARAAGGGFERYEQAEAQARAAIAAAKGGAL